MLCSTKLCDGEGFPSELLAELVQLPFHLDAHCAPLATSAPSAATARRMRRRKGRRSGACATGHRAAEGQQGGFRGSQPRTAFAKVLRAAMYSVWVGAWLAAQHMQETQMQGSNVCMYVPHDICIVYHDICVS